MTDVHVVGVGMTRFGKHPDKDATDLGSEALLEAIDDSGIDARLIESAYVGHVFQGMVTGQRILAQVGLAGIPLANVENACSSGATAIREASLAIRAGENDVVVAIGTEH
ncbi:MAG: beta-ketoacyl synthase N-terminal-like domain-containing protein, partial [Acidimicrobiia bacterium]